MPAKDLIIDPAELDCGSVIADLEQIRARIPQRDAMEQLTAIIYQNVETKVIAGYRDLTDEEFWVSGHMPGMPLMPGVLMCEAAAQVCSYFAVDSDLLGCDTVGFGGLDEVRFRGAVVPGDRLVVVAQMLQVRRARMIRARFQCFVEASLVCEGQLLGVPIPADAVRKPSTANSASGG